MCSSEKVISWLSSCRIRNSRDLASPAKEIISRGRRCSANGSFVRISQVLLLPLPTSACSNKQTRGQREQGMLSSSHVLGRPVSLPATGRIRRWPCRCAPAQGLMSSCSSCPGYLAAGKPVGRSSREPQQQKGWAKECPSRPVWAGSCCLENLNFGFRFLLQQIGLL